jgi:hypothetical protein
VGRAVVEGVVGLVAARLRRAGTELFNTPRWVAPSSKGSKSSKGPVALRSRRGGAASLNVPRWVAPSSKSSSGSSQLPPSRRRRRVVQHAKVGRAVVEGVEIVEGLVALRSRCGGAALLNIPRWVAPSSMWSSGSSLCCYRRASGETLSPSRL